MDERGQNWPCLTRYAGEPLREVAFPLGGIGTGTVSLGGRAELRDFEIMNTPAKGFNPPYCFFALRCEAAGREPVARVLEGVLQPPYGGAFGVRTPLAGLPRMREVRLDAAYPLARYTLGDPDVPLEIALEAFNPLAPLDVEASSLPVAVLRYVLHNPTNAPVEYSIAGSLYNCIGSESGCCGSGPTISPGALDRLLGGNENVWRQGGAVDGTPLEGLLMRSTLVAPRMPQDGSMALVLLGQGATYRRTWGPTQWNRHILAFWDDFTEDGRLEDPAEGAPSPRGQGQIGSLAACGRLAPGQTARHTFLLCWHFPHRTAAGCGWNTPAEDGGWVGNHYAVGYQDAWDVAVQVAPRLTDLEARTVRFVDALVSTNLPQAVKEAALNNVSTLRSPTCFRTADGNFFGFEGTCDGTGCCYGSCTHVWNYEQTTPSLFPELARNMRSLELEQGTLPDGMNCFRLRLPLGGEPWRHAAADGQMGVVMKCYREWQAEGDTAYLERHWPTIRSLVSYAWLPGGWDADQDGVMEGVQHNTYDVEFYGPNPLTGIWYLGALRAAAEMARAVGDEAFAARSEELGARGSAWIDGHLFNGDYYVQELRTPARIEDTLPALRAGMGEVDLADPDFQLGAGCLVDQLVGQYMAHVVGLGHLLDPQHVRKALESLFRYNYRESMYAHWNNMRTFALADEAGLLIGTWPCGGRPRVPFPYFGEVMTGFEYQAAAHMVYEGLVEEGLTVARAVRARFDGRRRNPWDEQECGHHYARAMAAWALLPALSGQRYSAITHELCLRPRWQPEEMRSLWTTWRGWGIVEQRTAVGRQEVRWEVLTGVLECVERLTLALPEGAAPHDVAVAVVGTTVEASWTFAAGTLRITLAEPAALREGHDLVVRITLG
ncbi:MAG: GH116 family glycosyl-hydrolase [Anaerolineae bacterium]